jgi:NitT/TauT family transport system permease protein
MHQTVTAWPASRLSLDWRDSPATTIVSGDLILRGAHQMIMPISSRRPVQMTLSPVALSLLFCVPTMRMLTALLLPCSSPFTYATLAATSRRPEVLFIPLLDVLQLVPVIGDLSFTVLFFLNIPRAL